VVRTGKIDAGGNKMTQRITLMLEDSEMVALRQAARKELRKPRDHARFLLRAMLDGPLAPVHFGSNEIGNTSNFSTGTRAANGPA
jgi:hypothetical protein